MNDYEQQLKAYSFPESKDTTEKFFKKYWLNETELSSNWISIKNQIYNKDAFFIPDIMFNTNYGILPLIGGLIFTEEDFTILKKCMIELNEEYFVIIEDYDIDNPPHKSGPPLRFKFPVSISWTELMDGGYISTELFQMPHKNYFVFGDSGKWGKYVANDYRDPLDLIGFEDNTKELFLTNFELEKNDIKDLKKMLPKSYRKLKNLYL